MHMWLLLGKYKFTVEKYGLDCYNPVLGPTECYPIECVGHSVDPVVRDKKLVQWPVSTQTMHL